MSHTKVYQGTEEEKQFLAIADCKFWLGDKYEYTKEELAKHCENVGQAIFALSFVGIQGYPAKVLAELALGKPKT